MVTLGLGAAILGVAALCFGGIPGGIALPVSTETVSLGGIDIAADKLVAAAALCVGLVSWFFRRSRTGIALSAIADDQQAALAAGIDVRDSLGGYRRDLGDCRSVVDLRGGRRLRRRAGRTQGVPIIIIGGLDSVPGTIIGAMIIGLLVSLGAGYLDPHLGGGFGNVASYLLLLVMLVLRPMAYSGGRGQSAFEAASVCERSSTRFRGTGRDAIVLDCLEQRADRAVPRLPGQKASSQLSPRWREWIRTLGPPTQRGISVRPRCYRRRLGASYPTRRRAGTWRVHHLGEEIERSIRRAGPRLVHGAHRPARKARARSRRWPQMCHRDLRRLIDCATRCCAHKN
jgi:hypothetical protein